MPAIIMACADFSEFLEALKGMRKTEDIIINTINTVIPTDSFHKDNVAACKDLNNTLHDGNKKRENFIQNCIDITSVNVNNLKEQYESNEGDIHLKTQLKNEQIKLRMLKVELTVEDMLKQRTAKVFNERCRRYYKPL